MNGKIELTWIDENIEEEVIHQFPAKNEVCSRCEGYGTHLNPNIGEHAYSVEEFNESFPDYEDKEEYFRRGGIYDVACHDCKGNKIVLVVDEDQLNKEQKDLYTQYQKHEEQVARWNAEERMTRYYESGGYG